MSEIMLLGETDPQFITALRAHFETIQIFEYPRESCTFLPSEFFEEILTRSEQFPAIALALPLNIPGQKMAASLNLIYQLRLRHMNNPIVVYGFETLQLILQKEPRSLLLGAPRVVYVRRNVSFQDWSALIESLNYQTISAQVQEPYLQLKERQAYLERLDRHELGNLIGALPFAQAACEAGLIDHSALEELQTRNFQIRSGPAEEYTLIETLLGPRSILGLDYHTPVLLAEQIKNKVAAHYQRPIRVVFVDDHWEQGGWGDFWRILLGISAPLLNQSEGKALAQAEHAELWCFHELDKVLPTFQYENYIDCDLLILDLNLKGKAEMQLPLQERSGYQALQTLKQIDISLPVLMFTASASSDHFRALKEEGALAFISKASADPGANLEKIVAAFEQMMAERWLRPLWQQLCQTQHILALSAQNQYEQANAEFIGQELMYIWGLFQNRLPKFLSAFQEPFENQALVKAQGIAEKWLNKPRVDAYYYLNELRNEILHCGYKAQLEESLYGLVCLMSLITNPSWTSPPPLNHWLQAHLGLPTSTILPKYEMTYELCQIAYPVGSKVHCKLSKLTLNENGTLTAMLKLPNGHIVIIDDFENQVDIQLCHEKNLIQQEIDAARSYRKFEKNSRPPKIWFKIVAYDHLCENRGQAIKLSPEYAPMAEQTTGIVTQIHPNGNLFFSLPDQRVGFVPASKVADFSFKLGQVVPVEVIRFNPSPFNNWYCKLRLTDF